jgi:3-phosphoshikimate 1-carboxyvinyltransferase
MKYVISGPSKSIQDTIYIPSSKSISNRILIIRALAGSRVQMENLSDSDDTKALRKALVKGSSIKDVGHAGTTMRFLTAYFATCPGEVILTGSHRMKQRPIGPLVTALRQLGTEVEYMEMDGCPPLKIRGGKIKGGSIEIDGGISSQFISALMMVGPVLEGGLRIKLTGKVVSDTYLRMTLDLMKQCGVDATFDGRHFYVPQQSYSIDSFKVEADWSGASYWYQIAAFLPGSQIGLPNLAKVSLQGDAILTQLFQPLGVESNFSREGVTLHSVKREVPGILVHDFTGCPDLVQTCVVTLCVMGVPFRFTGTKTLQVKETDRITALQTELNKVGFRLDCDAEGEWISWDGSQCQATSDPVIQTYHDHRMAMAFTPLAIPLGSITIEDPMVVTKSYPAFWNDLEKAGFEITEVQDS